VLTKLGRFKEAHKHLDQARENRSFQASNLNCTVWQHSCGATDSRGKIQRRRSCSPQSGISVRKSRAQMLACRCTNPTGNRSGPFGKGSPRSRHLAKSDRSSSLSRRAQPSRIGGAYFDWGSRSPVAGYLTGGISASAWVAGRLTKFGRAITTECGGRKTRLQCAAEIEQGRRRWPSLNEALRHRPKVIGVWARSDQTGAPTIGWENNSRSKIGR